MRSVFKFEDFRGGGRGEGGGETVDGFGGEGEEVAGS